MGTVILLIGLYLTVVLAIFWSEIVFKIDPVSSEDSPEIDDQKVSIKDNLKSFGLTVISLLAFGFIFVPMLLCTLVIGRFEKFKEKKYKKVLVVSKDWKPGFDLNEDPHKYLKHVYQDVTFPKKLGPSDIVTISGTICTVVGTRNDGVLIVTEGGR